MPPPEPKEEDSVVIPAKTLVKKALVEQKTVAHIKKAEKLI